MEAIEEESSDIEQNQEQNSTCEHNNWDLPLETNEENSAEDSDREEWTQENTEESLIKEEIRRRMQGYVDAYNAGDIDKVATFYAKDSFFVAPNRPFVRGQEGFLRCGIIKNLMDMGAKRMEIKEGDITASSHLTSVVGEFMLFDEDEDEFDDGRLVHVWVKVEDEWFLKYDIFN